VTAGTGRIATPLGGWPARLRRCAASAWQDMADRDETILTPAIRALGQAVNEHIGGTPLRKSQNRACG